jgi:hypothetical protein
MSSYYPPPPGTLIPSTGDFSAISTKSGNIFPDDDGKLNIITNTANGTKGTLALNAGSISIQAPQNVVYNWPTYPPPNTNYVLGIDDISTTADSTVCQLGWVPGSICFHASTIVTVRTRNGALLFMRVDKLVYGDEILTANGFSKIIDFTGIFPDRVGSSVKLYFDNDSLCVSGNHLILINDKYIQAKEAQTGQFLTSTSGRKQISKIETSIETGWYTPLTENGTIVANGVICSCHTTDKHEVVHAFYKPWRFFLYLFPYKYGTKPVEKYHWYSIGFRRSFIGGMVFKGFSWLYGKVY